MIKTVIFGITGETGLWVADAAFMGEAGVFITKGVDFSAAISASELPDTGIHEGND